MLRRGANGPSDSEGTIRNKPWEEPRCCSEDDPLAQRFDGRDIARCLLEGLESRIVLSTFNVATESRFARGHHDGGQQ